MSDLTVARRYARALYEEAARIDRTEKVDEDVDLIRASLEGSPELVRFFESPILSREKKEAVIGQLFAQRISPITLRFLKMLVEKKREDAFPAIVRAYRALRDEQMGIVEATARVARPLGDEEEKKLVQALERMAGKRVRLQVEQAPALLGGLIIRMGDTVYDGSVRHQLESLQQQLAQGAAIMN